MNKIGYALMLMGCSLTVAAQETDQNLPTMNHQVITNGFFSNWFVDVNADISAFYSSQEYNLPSASGSGSPFWSGRNVWGFSFAAGKWATPVFGMRVKVTGAWAKQVNQLQTASLNPTYHQWTVSLQPMLNLTKLFVGNKPRLWDTSIYAGVGVAVNMGGADLPNHTSTALYCSAGWLNTFNITRRYHINLDFCLAAGEAAMDGNAVFQDAKGVVRTHDKVFSVSLGLGVNLGKTGWQGAPDIDAILSMQQAEIDALNASIADIEAENERLRSESK